MGIKNFLADWIVPRGYLELNRNFRNFIRKEYPSFHYRRIRLNDYSLPLQRNKLDKHKNSFTGGKCFVLATGPSIREQDLKILKDEHCIAVSMFHLHEDIEILNPIWHVLAATHPPFNFATAKVIFDSLTARYDKGINFLIGNTNFEFSYFNYVKKYGNEFAEKYRDSIYFVDYGQSLEINSENYLDPDIWDLRVDPFTLRTVIYSAIQLAYFLGFKEIVLVGCDHDYLKDISRIENHHFYPDSIAYSDRKNLIAFDRERWFYEYYMRWKQYKFMREFLFAKGVKVYNATHGGMLDVFERRRLEDCI